MNYKLKNFRKTTKSSFPLQRRSGRWKTANFEPPSIYDIQKIYCRLWGLCLCDSVMLYGRTTSLSAIEGVWTGADKRAAAGPRVLLTERYLLDQRTKQSTLHISWRLSIQMISRYYSNWILKSVRCKKTGN